MCREGGGGERDCVALLEIAHDICLFMGSNEWPFPVAPVCDVCRSAA